MFDRQVGRVTEAEYMHYKLVRKPQVGVWDGGAQLEGGHNKAVLQGSHENTVIAMRS